MKDISFLKWCHTATKKIVFPPARRAVVKELRQHMEDRYVGFTDKGFFSDEASRNTLSAMGNAEDLAIQLAEVHPPRWGYAVWICYALAVILVIFATLAVKNARPTRTHLAADFYFTATSHAGFQRVSLDAQNAEFAYGNYHFLLQQAALWESSHTHTAAQNAVITKYTLYLQIRVTQPPFQPAFDGWKNFWAQDNHGNIYSSGTESIGYVGFVNHYGDVFYDTGYLEINGIPTSEVQWIDLHYDVDGHNVVVRIDMTGGERS